MFTANEWKSRFNLLYLHENEVKTDEKQGKCQLVDKENGKTVSEVGVWHFGSKSLFFEPESQAQPIIKFMMKHMSGEVVSKRIIF